MRLGRSGSGNERCWGSFLMNAEAKQAGKKKGALLRQVLGIGISVVCLVLVFRKIDFAQLRAAIETLKWHYLALGLISLVVDYAMRIQRWAVMLRAGGASVSGVDSAAPFLGSITLNNVLPFRAGDLVRAFVFPASIGVRRVTAAASLLFERLIDLITLLLALGVGLWLSSMSSLPEWLGRTVVILAVVGGGILIAIVTMNSFFVRILLSIKVQLDRHGKGKLGSAVAVLIDLTSDIGRMARPQVLVSVLFLSAIVWVGETGLFWAVMKGLSIQAGFSSALMIMAVATLSTLVPSSPGYVGPFHLAAYSAAVMLGGSPAQAASFALLAHLGLWLPTTLAGSIAILTRPALFKGRAAESES